MNASEKLFLQWNDFKDNISSSFAELREDQDLTDVTLACEDGKQVEAHKVILAASSPFFKDILKRNKHPHPLIYMRGLRSEDLLAIIDFLYFGEANVPKENLDSFLALAEELQLKGLTGSDNSVKDQHFTKASTIKREKQSQAPTFPEDFNADDSEEAQEIIQKLTNQLYTQEDKYVKMKAENLSKDQTIRTLSQSLSKLDGKFQSFKSDRADLVKNLELNKDLIKKLEVVSEAVKARDVEIESLKDVEKPKTKNATHRQDIEKMRTVMAKQSRALVNLEVSFKQEKSELLLKIANLEEELKNHNTLKVEDEALQF